MRQSIPASGGRARARAEPDEGLAALPRADRQRDALSQPLPAFPAASARAWGASPTHPRPHQQDQELSPGQVPSLPNARAPRRAFPAAFPPATNPSDSSSIAPEPSPRASSLLPAPVPGLRVHLQRPLCCSLTAPGPSPSPYSQVKTQSTSS